MEAVAPEKKRILLVEDDDFISDIYITKFTKTGYEVIYAANGQEALEKARSCRPDIILLDLMMPVKNGFETLQELKADPNLKNIQVIILTNLSQEEDKRAVLSMGAVDYCVKATVSFAEMLKKIDLYLKGTPALISA